MVSAYINIFFIFVLMFIGYVLTYKQWFSNQIGDAFSKLVLQIALPCNMFLTITKNFSRSEFLHLVGGMVIPLISMLLTFLVSFIYCRIFRITPARKGIFSTMFTCSNTIFIGLPINLAIFGEQAVPYVARDNPQIEQATVKFHLIPILKKIFSPALLGFLLGLCAVLVNLSVSDSIATFLGYLANLTTPLSMFVIGIIVYNVGIKNLTLNRDIIGVLVGRYVISPLIVWLLGQWISVPPLMLSVFIIQAAMPVQNSVPILARSYGADQQFAASSLGYSVLLYLAYIPLLLKLIL